jgi:deazaflavin-dependent oxidoreductase (nitroreductase family)
MSLEDFTEALKDADEIELTVTGRKSGRKLPRPVWFVQDRRRLYLLPISGSDSQWFKNILANPKVRLAIDGAELEATAKPITDPNKVSDVIDRFRDKYGKSDVKRYYTKLDAAVEIPLS